MERRNFLKGAALTAGTAAAATTLAAPAIAQSRKELVIVSTWGRDFPGLGISAQRLAARITELSEGRINTQYFAAGERVGAFDSFDEVASGNAQAYIAADYYWKGKHPGWAFFTSVPFGLTNAERSAWLKYKGGQELWDELAAGFGLKCLVGGSTGTQMGGWFNKEIESADDLKGLKFRIPGLGGDVMAKLGASPPASPSFPKAGSPPSTSPATSVWAPSTASTKSPPATLRPILPQTTTGKASTRAGLSSPRCPSA